MKKMIREGVKCKKKSEKSLKTPLVPPNANLHWAPLPQIIENSIFLAIKLLNGYLCTRVGSMRVKSVWNIEVRLKRKEVNLILSSRPPASKEMFKNL